MPEKIAKSVPSLEERKLIASAVGDRIKSSGLVPPVSQTRLYQLASALLRDIGLSPDYAGYTMVLVNNEVWEDRFFNVPFDRRLLLLPHCLRNSRLCQGEYDEVELTCAHCNRCMLSRFQTTAEQLGYTTLIAEGTPIVLKLILAGRVDAILGVSCLNTLEKAFPKLSAVGIPAYAVPLLRDNCVNTKVDSKRVMEAIARHSPVPGVDKRDYRRLKDGVERLFTSASIGAHLPPRRVPFAHRSGKKPDVAVLDAYDGGDLARRFLGKTDRVAREYLVDGGRHFRPYLTVATYYALTGHEEIPEHVGRVAIGIEAFHKASLIHDDIQDGEDFRYGKPTLHREYNTGIAINMGDYVLGVGYNLFASIARDCPADSFGPILESLSAAHTALAAGQGAELFWKWLDRKELTREHVYEIYAGKTAPAFEAALGIGALLAGCGGRFAEVFAEYSHNLGIAFQVKNDLKDLAGDFDNKRCLGRDGQACCPTILLALALEHATASEKEHLNEVAVNAAGWADATTALYEKYDVQRTAEALQAEFYERAAMALDKLDHHDLKVLLGHVLEYIFHREEVTIEASRASREATAEAASARQSP